MIKEFFIFVLVLLSMTGGILLHYATYDATAEQFEISRMVAVTKLPSPSWSVAFYEPRVFLLENAINPAYPQMQAIDKMDLVYAK